MKITTRLFREEATGGIIGIMSEYKTIVLNFGTLIDLAHIVCSIVIL